MSDSKQIENQSPASEPIEESFMHSRIDGENSLFQPIKSIRQTGWTYCAQTQDPNGQDARSPDQEVPRMEKCYDRIT